nr:hypothetical protein [Halomonas sp.]
MSHDRTPVARAELPGTGASTAQRKPSGVTTAAGRKRAEHAQPLTASTPWYGEGKQQDRPTPRPLHTLTLGKRSAQAPWAEG